MTFANSYTLSTGIRRIIVAAPAAMPVATLVLGGAVATALAADGTIVWSRSLALADYPLSLVDAVACNDGGFALLAGLKFSPDGERFSDFVIFRMDRGGNLTWSRPFHGNGWLSLGRLAKRGDGTEEFLCMAWYAQPATGRPGAAASLLVLAANGDPRLAAVVDLGDQASRVFDVTATPSGYMLSGDCAPHAPWWDSEGAMLYDALGTAGILLSLDYDLKLLGGWTVTCAGESRGLSLRAALSTPQGLVVVGATADKRTSSLAAALTFTSGLPVGSVVRATPLDNPHVLPSRIAGSGDELLILCRDMRSSVAATAAILRLGGDLAATAHYGLNFDGGTTAGDLAADAGTCFVAGTLPSLGNRHDGWVLATGRDLTCCRAKALKPQTNTKIELVFAPIKVTIAPARPDKTPATASAKPVDVALAPLCGSGIDLSGESLVQSPHLSLQAAGSDGSHAARGILLRWFMAGALATHLPKGDLAGTTVGFNRPADVMSVYRAPWPANAPMRQLALASAAAASVDDPARVLYFQSGSATPRDLFTVRCLDAVAYTAAKLVANPLTQTAAFLAAYGDHPIEIELRGRLSVACDLGFSGNAIRVEVVGASENRPTATRHVTTRRLLGPGDGPVARLYGENICCVRVQGSSAHLLSVAFIAYDDVLTRLNADHAWMPVGEFALSTDQATVFNRLENPGQVDVHGVWPRFTDAAFVNVDNYHDRWTAPQVGLGAAVATYVQLSNTDPQAIAQIPGANPDDGTISLSYLDLLSVAASDFHCARMLGLGHVDAAVTASTPYVHLCVYSTLADLGDGRGARPVRHLYMSLPTALGDGRLPITPEFDAIGYGLSVPTGTGAPYALTDANGYTPDGTARYVRLQPGCRALYAPETGFFAPPDLFDLSRSNLPVSYGVEYRALNEAVWRKPEIAHDDHYVDTATPPCPEILVTPFPATQTAGAFIHKETEAGIHAYAVFGVDLFSRPSALSPPRATDATVFKKRNSLLPPSDIQTQFIQEESTLVLTTATEQAMLSALKQAHSDLTLVRVCCNFGMTQDDAYGFADTIDILHRRDIPSNVTCGVLAVTNVSPTLAQIATQPYTFSSGQVASPDLPQAMKAHFVGGILVAGGQRLVIADILWPGSTGANPTFVVRKPTTSGVVATADGNTLVIEDALPDLHSGDLCMAIENMAALANWGSGNPLAATIAIGDGTWTQRTEAFTRPNGTSVSRRLRGVWSTATIYDSTPSNAPTNAPRQYDAVFDTYVLQPHPQAGDINPVTWYKGTVRLSVAGNDPEDRRALTVRQTLIDNTGRLVLRFIDDSGQAGPPLTGSARLVNYYPGYKIYLYADTAHDFDAGHLLPAGGEGSRTSILALASRDSTTQDDQGQAYRSNPSAPQLIAAAENIDPLPPQRPRGLAYASPPDSEGRSTYTLNLAFDHTPFAVVVYRADALAILDALYDNASLAAIRAAIFPSDIDAWFANRFDDLFAFLDDARQTPAAFPAPDGFALPVPDAAALAIGQVLTANDKAKIKAAVFKAFVPLSQQPLIYDRIHTDPDYIPTHRKQTFRNANGDLLSPTDPAFDLAPMAKRTAPDSIQFTDFTLDGAMNANTVYFYFAREIGSRMQMSDPGLVWGPVKLVNLQPPAVPVLRKMTVIPADAATAARPRVGFELIAPAPVDPIARLRIYRTIVDTEALSVRTMQVLPEIDLMALAQTADGTYLVADDFATDSVIPYGERLHYRLAWVRDVAWEDESGTPQLTSVASTPTRLFLANLVDVINPLPPVPTIIGLSLANNGNRFVKLRWDKTVHNGTYYPAQLQPSGTWTRLGSVTSNALSVEFALPDALPNLDEDGNVIYYRFKIDVQNSSGLINLDDAPITISLDTL